MTKVEFNQDLYSSLSNSIRVLTIDAVERARSGHPGMPLGMADVVTILFSEFLKFNPQNPKWENRDRFVLSAGHGSMLLYSLLYLTGYKDISLDDIKNFRQLHSKAAGHPEYGLLQGIECTTGPLGQGFATAVGMAIAQKLNAEKIGANIINNRTYVVVGDGCLMEGISHEAASLAGHLCLEKLVVLFDSNNITIDGEKSLSDSEDVLRRFLSYGWEVNEVDGHDFDEIRSALSRTQNSKKPSFIKFNTKIGFGAPTKEGKSSSHGSPLGKEEVLAAKKKYGWEGCDEFFIPEDLLNVWRNDIGRRSQGCYDSWVKEVSNLNNERTLHLKYLSCPFSILDTNKSLSECKKVFADRKDVSTRVASRKILEVLSRYVPSFCGGSADLSESNCTKFSGMIDVNKSNFYGNYINYGIREHAMGAVINGLALFGGVIPYAGTFLVFSDYARPSIRLSALMRQRVVYVMTHDSIGVGEDGPTHHPVEHLASLRAMPGVNVMRPADAIETAECWHIALADLYKPTILCLTRQNVASLRDVTCVENFSERGGYIISDHSVSELQVTIFATGSEVEIAMRAQKILEEKQIGTRVVSMPCFEVFDEQDSDYRNNILDNKSVKVAVEAGVRFGWEKYIGSEGLFVGMRGFSESAPAKDLYEFFGITSEEVVKQILERL